MKDTREEILDLAENLIRKKGYSNFSYKDISSALDIKNAAVHYHFPSKTDLGVAVIEKSINNLKSAVSSWQKATAPDQLSRFMDTYANSASAGMLCFMGALGSSYASLPDEMKQKLHEASQLIRQNVREILEKGKADGAFQFTVKTEAQADLIISSLLASLILNQVTKEDVLKNITESIQSII